MAFYPFFLFSFSSAATMTNGWQKPAPVKVLASSGAGSKWQSEMGGGKKKFGTLQDKPTPDRGRTKSEKKNEAIIKMQLCIRVAPGPGQAQKPTGPPTFPPPHLFTFFHSNANKIEINKLGYWLFCFVFKSCILLSLYFNDRVSFVTLSVFSF